MKFLPVAPLSRLLSHTRHSLLFHRYPPSNPLHESYKLLLFRLASPTPLLPSSKPEYYAMEATCPHLGADLGAAEIEDMVVICPWHQYEFNIKTGDSETGMRLCTFQVEVRADEWVWVESPGKTGEEGWEVVKFEPISEAFADITPPAHLHDPLPPTSTTEPPSLASLQIATDPSSPPASPALPSQALPTTLLTYALLILKTASPSLKVSYTRSALAFLRAQPPNVPLVTREEAIWAAKEVGDETPPREESTGGTREPGKMARRGKGGNEKSRGLMLHALANIEQWAIDLAWDVIVRFAVTEINGQHLPNEFYLDWAKVAEDEAKHFSLLVDLLHKRGIKYGDHAVHAGLWDSARDTNHSLRSRLCIIHMVHEARGLDVNPITIEKFKKAGDLEAVDALVVIHSDEVTHVTAGHKWFTWVCKNEGVEPIPTFRAEVQQNFRGKVKGPFNEEDRRLAGMTPEFYEDLEGFGSTPSAQKNGEVVEGEIHPRLT
ncbi:hypothetical protein BDY24DRAFT_412002 [Mrakia frigida]|uniref:uncharacterized protein n=1 Tax=Mrakia frigida TaxID=29902 RepID=UPI003FCC1623